MVNSLSPSVIQLIQDLNGNHVVQRSLQKLGPRYNQVTLPPPESKRESGSGSGIGSESEEGGIEIESESVNKSEKWKVTTFRSVAEAWATIQPGHAPSTRK